MDINKLKISNFSKILLKNIPADIDLGISSTEDNPEVIIYYIEVIIYYINNIEDLENFVKFCNIISLPEENRTIMVYKKGQKELNRDSIITPFKSNEIKGFKLKAPMLCSLSKEYSAFVMMKTE